MRTAEPSDDDAVVDLWGRAGMLASIADPHGDLARTHEQQSDLVLVAERTEGVVGTVTGTWEGGRGWIMRLAVAPEHRGQGIATALLTELEARLAARGAEQANLLVFTDNREALGFWRARGYRSVAPVVLMTRDLAPPPG